MSNSTATLADPFEASTLDEETEMAALASSLRLADGFRLLFARCNQPNQRVRLIGKLMAQFPPETILGVHFSEPIPHLLDALRERLPVSSPRAIFVSGLEYSLPVAAEAERASFIANLNAARNSFPSIIPCPLVLWLPEYALTAVIRGAPDFFSIRSGVYFFASSPEETAPLISAIIAGDAWQLASSPFLERQDRVEAIENLLQDYQTLPSRQRDYQAEAQLMERLGHLYDTLGQWAKAEQAYQQDLQICRDLGHRQGEGAMLNNLGVIYRKQKRWTEAEQAHRRALQICRELASQEGEAATLNNLGVVYRNQSHWGEAEQAYRQSLQIFHELGDRQGEGAALNNLGLIHQDRTEWAEAEGMYQRSLQLRRDIGDRQGEATILNNLGNVYRRQGRWAEAEGMYQQSLQLCRDLGDLQGEGGTLGNLALAKEAEGDIEGAINFGRAAIQVLMVTEDATLLKKTQTWVEEWESLVQTSSHSQRFGADN